MKDYIEHYRALWAARAPRERLLIASLAVFLIAALLLQLLWSSHQARARLGRQIPQLRLQVETLQRKAADLQQLRAQQPAATSDRSALLASAIASARAGALPEVASILQQEAPGRLRLRGTLPFDRWLGWTAAIQREGRLRIVACRIETGDAPGTAKIDALYSLPDAE